MNKPQPWWLTWPIAEVAATILAPLSHKVREEYDAMETIVNWFRTGVFRAPPPKPFRAGIWGSRVLEDPDFRAAAEAMQVLERAGLLIRVLQVSDSSSFLVGITRLGMHADQTNTVREHLGLPAHAPTGLRGTVPTDADARDAAQALSGKSPRPDQHDQATPDRTPSPDA
jgi:hypothetical protein